MILKKKKKKVVLTCFVTNMLMWGRGGEESRGRGDNKKRPKLRVTFSEAKEANGPEERGGTYILLRGPGSGHKPSSLWMRN